MMTAKAVARAQESGAPRLNDLTKKNVAKVTRYRQDGKEAFDNLVESFREKLRLSKKGERSAKVGEAES